MTPGIGTGELTHAVVVKAYVWRDGRLLLLKRRDDDDEYPGLWDTPGGRLAARETARDGLVREVREETGLVDIGPPRPLSVWDFQGRAGLVLGISFLAPFAGGEVALSGEHVAFDWVDPADLDHYPAADNLIREIRWIVKQNWHR